MTALAIKATSRGPVFFTQERDTISGRPFTIYKFRTMCVDAEAKKGELRSLSEQDGPAFKMTDDPRVTPVGRFLRKTSIDELPQLFNVLLGDMSLVGPRPLPCDESHRCEAWQRRRLDVTPGLTCIWQVQGRSNVSFSEWARMDMQYIRSRSLMADLALLLKTIPAVIFRRGATERGQLSRSAAEVSLRSIAWLESCAARIRWHTKSTQIRQFKSTAQPRRARCPL